MLETVYAFVKTYIQQHGYSPSVREIADGCYIHFSTAIRCLDKLEARGRLARDPGKARSIRLLEKEGSDK